MVVDEMEKGELVLVPPCTEFNWRCIVEVYIGRKTGARIFDALERKPEEAPNWPCGKLEDEEQRQKCIQDSIKVENIMDKQPSSK